jgi:small subunit ribosomal protein S20
MPVTKTAKRALRGSTKKGVINKLILSKLDVAIRQAKKSKTLVKITQVVSLADRAAKKRIIHKNKAARIKSQMAKLLPKTNRAAKKTTSKKKK